MNPNSDTLADLFVGARRSVGLTQAQLAETSGVKREYLSSIEQGRIHLVYPIQMNAVKRVLKIPGWLLLEAMGYETDVSTNKLNPELVTALFALTPPQQSAVLNLIRTLMPTKEGNDVIQS